MPRPVIDTSLELCALGPIGDSQRLQISKGEKKKKRFVDWEEEGCINIVFSFIFFLFYLVWFLLLSAVASACMVVESSQTEQNNEGKRN